MDYVCPKSHYLESWGDANPYSSVYCIQQPTTNPLFDSRQVEQNLLNWIESNASYYDFLKSFYKSLGYKKSWNKILHDGFVV